MVQARHTTQIGDQGKWLEFAFGAVLWTEIAKEIWESLINSVGRMWI
jgi:hypothetical protein